VLGCHARERVRARRHVVMLPLRDAALALPVRPQSGGVQAAASLAGAICAGLGVEVIRSQAWEGPRKARESQLHMHRQSCGEKQ
jgi:hypothetical protein